MFDSRSHCDFLIPNLFGRCQCTSPAKLVGGFCLESNDIVSTEVATSVPSSTSTTPISTTTTTTTGAPVTTTTSAAEPERYDSVEEQSTFDEIAESPANSDADMDLPTTTPQQLLTPATAEEQSHIIAADEILPQETTPVADDYPYKIDDEYDIDDVLIQQQQLQQSDVNEKLEEEQGEHLPVNEAHIVEDEHVKEDLQQPDDVKEDNKQADKEPVRETSHAVQQEQLDHITESHIEADFVETEAVDETSQIAEQELLDHVAEDHKEFVLEEAAPVKVEQTVEKQSQEDHKEPNPVEIDPVKEVSLLEKYDKLDQDLEDHKPSDLVEETFEKDSNAEEEAMQVADGIPNDSDDTSVAEEPYVAETSFDNVDIVSHPLNEHELETELVRDEQNIETEQIAEEQGEGGAEQIVEDKKSNNGAPQLLNEREHGVEEHTTATQQESNNESEQNVKTEQPNFDTIPVAQYNEPEQTTAGATKLDDVEHFVEEASGPPQGHQNLQQELENNYSSNAAETEHIAGEVLENVPKEPHNIESSNLIETGQNIPQEHQQNEVSNGAENQYVQAANENEQGPESNPVPQAEEESTSSVETQQHSQHNQYYADDLLAATMLPHDATDAPNSMSSEQQYVEFHPEMEMYEDVEHEEEHAADIADNTMKFDYETAQDEFNSGNTEASNVDESFTATDSLNWAQEYENAPVVSSMSDFDLPPQAPSLAEYENQNEAEEFSHQHLEENEVVEAHETESEVQLAQPQPPRLDDSTLAIEAEETENVENESFTAVNDLNASNADSESTLVEQEHNNNGQITTNVDNDKFDETEEVSAAITERIAPEMQEENILAPEDLQAEPSNDEEIQVNEPQLQAHDFVVEDSLDEQTNKNQKDNLAAEDEQHKADEDVVGSTGTVTEKIISPDSDGAASELVQQVADNTGFPHAYEDEQLTTDTVEIPSVPNAAEETVVQKENEASVIDQNDKQIVEEATVTTQLPLLQENDVEAEEHNEIIPSAELNKDNVMAESETHTGLYVLEEGNELGINNADEIKPAEQDLENVVSEKAPIPEPFLESDNGHGHSSVEENEDLVDQAQLTEQTMSEDTTTAVHESDVEDIKVVGDPNKFEQITNVDEIIPLEPLSHTSFEHINPIEVDNSLGSNKEAANLSQTLALKENSEEDIVTSLPDLDYAPNDSFKMPNNVQKKHIGELLNHSDAQTETNFIDFNDQDKSLPQSVTHTDIYSESFEEQESIADILSDLMSEDVTTTTPLEAVTEVEGVISQEDSDGNEKENINVQPDDTVVHAANVTAAVTNIVEENLAMPQQIETTEAHESHDNKLITFYPEAQDLSVQASNDIEAPQVSESATHFTDLIVESSTKAEILEETDHTLSPEEMPFDLTSIDDIHPEELESDSLILETTTASNVIYNLKEEESSGDSAQEIRNDEATATPGDIVEITTQTMLGLASRVTLMEPAAPIVTTLKPLMTEVSSENEATPEPVKELPGTENILSVKPNTGD